MTYSEDLEKYQAGYDEIMKMFDDCCLSDQEDSPIVVDTPEEMPVIKKVTKAKRVRGQY